MNGPDEDLVKDRELLARIKESLPRLEALLREASSHWEYEDPVYRFYHYSFKVYGLQGTTRKIVEALRDLAPGGTDFCSLFKEILKEGTGKLFEPSHNAAWSRHTRPILEAFFHAKYFLEMAVKYGKELKDAPELLPSGWAALLELYGIR